MKKLNNDFVKLYKNKSGICHHMMFETKYINEIFDIIFQQHNDVFFNVFLKCVDTQTTS